MERRVKIAVVERSLAILRRFLLIHRSEVAFPEVWAPIRFNLQETMKELMKTSGSGGGGKEEEDEEEEDLATAKSSKEKTTTINSSKKKKKQKNNNKRLKASDTAWVRSSLRLMDDLVEEADEWANRCVEARVGKTQGFKRISGPGDLEACAQFSKRMREEYARNGGEDSEKKSKKKTKTSKTLRGEIEGPEWVENDDDDNNKNGKGDEGEDDEDEIFVMRDLEDAGKQEEEEDEEEGVTALDPSEFL